MAENGVNQQEPHEEQEGNNERTDTKAEERDEGRETKTEANEEQPATRQQKEEEEPPVAKPREEPPATKQREEPPATKQREEQPATKRREEPPPTRDEDRGGDSRDDTQSGSETTKGHDAQRQSQTTKNSEDSNAKTADDSTTKGTTKTNRTSGESLARRDNDDHTQKNTKSVSKGGDSTNKEGTKSPKSILKKNTTKKDTTGSPDRKTEEDTKRSESKKRGTKGDNAEQEKKEDDAADGSANDTSRSSHAELSEGRSKQKEFFKLELQRLESSLKRESSKIIAPSKKPHTPYIFNTLEPYYNTQITRYLIELPDEMKHGHTSRRTAQGLTDPWVDLKMDRDILPKVPSKPVSRQVAILKREKEIRDRKKRSAMSQSSTSRKGGSTRLPKFPVVHLETQDLATKQLFYSDVPFLRSELKSKYSSSARSKIDEDYKRTQQDFFRMELDKLDEVHPVNRRHMRSAYFAYLQNTPGSKKAITDCVRSLESGKAQ